MHCHIAGPKVNMARKMRPEEKRRDPPIHRTAKTHSGTMGSVPSTFATGYKYIGLGYTTAFDAASKQSGTRRETLAGIYEQDWLAPKLALARKVASVTASVPMAENPSK